VGETEQLAVTFLLTTKYPTEVVIPTRIKSLPVVLKNSFRFIILLTIYCAAHIANSFNLIDDDAPLFFIPFFPRVKTRGYKHLTPTEFPLKISMTYKVQGVNQFEYRS